MLTRPATGWQQDHSYNCSLKAMPQCQTEVLWHNGGNICGIETVCTVINQWSLFDCFHWKRQFFKYAGNCAHVEKLWNNYQGVHTPKNDHALQLSILESFYIKPAFLKSDTHVPFLSNRNPPWAPFNQTSRHFFFQNNTPAVFSTPRCCLHPHYVSVCCLFKLCAN